MNSIRDKLRRKLSMKEENPNFDDYNDENDVDDDFHGNLVRPPALLIPEGVLTCLRVSQRAKT